MIIGNLSIWRCIPQHIDEEELKRTPYHNINRARERNRLDVIQKIHIDIPLFLGYGSSIRYGQYMNSWTEAEGEYYEDPELSTLYALKIGEIEEEDIPKGD